jgi:knotted carbamoyltransferase YgeW
MDKNDILRNIESLSTKKVDAMYLNDFLLTWDKSADEIDATFQTAEILRAMRDHNISCSTFDTGLAISIFRDQSTRTRFSFASACSLLGLALQELDEEKSQIAHGETVRETANMISFLAEVIGIRDDIYLGEGHTYMKEVARAVHRGHREGVLPQRPTLVNLQCDIDHPTQTLSDALHLSNTFGGVENLKGKKIAISWAYSPSYGKPLSVPQGIIGLMTRFGMDVVLAHPAGYNLMSEVVAVAQTNKPTASSPADRLPRRYAWRKPSKAPMSFTRKAGRLTASWKNAPDCCRPVIVMGLKHLKSAVWKPTNNLSTGNAARN